MSRPRLRVVVRSASSDIPLVIATPPAIPVASRAASSDQ
jgi:hypothetical protein